MRSVTLTCSVCGKKWQRLRMIGARPKRCPECRRPVAVAPPPLVIPAEAEFTPLGPCGCQGCGLPVWWARGRTRLMGRIVWKSAWRDEGGHMHRCPGWAAEAVAALTVQLGSWDNGRVGSSDQSNSIANGARASATTGGAGVVLPHEVVAR